MTRIICPGCRWPIPADIGTCPRCGATGHELKGAQPAPIADLAEGERRKREGIDRVERSNGQQWLDNALAAVRAIRPGWEGTGSDLRMILAVPEPSHPNVWGSLVRCAVQKRLLEQTGRFAKVKHPAGHARKTEVLRRT